MVIAAPMFPAYSAFRLGVRACAAPSAVPPNFGLRMAEHYDTDGQQRG
jgi:hypothetical protein